MAETPDKLEPGKPNSQVTYWLAEIQASKKREKDFRKDGQRILEIYGGEKSSTTPFNVLYSNTETMLPALYSAVPKPVVERRYKSDDALGKAAATAGARGLEFLLDTNVEGYETFDEAMRSATLDGLLPGRGVTCVKYDADVKDIPGEGEEEPTPYKRSELVCTDTQSWNRVYFGYAKKWSKVPWVAYEQHIDRQEAERLFGPEIASVLVYTESEDADDKKDEDQGERKTVCVYQIWDKDTKTLKYVTEQKKDGFLKEQPDPLGLTGFFNCPKPLQFLEKSNDLSPTALYQLYENQAKELNELSRRISRIAKAIKAKGVYDGELGEDIKRIAEADDNELIPADKASSLAAEKGLQNAIWFMPIDKLIVVLRELYAARENCKQVIYEITGIADIMRGQSNASETLGAQQIKNSWGTLRLKRLQKEVQRYARDLLRMMLEIAAKKFSEETWARMTGLPFMTSADRQRLQAVAQAAQQAAAMGDQNAQKQMAELQQQLQTPVWSDVLALLKDDIQRSYRIDIETNSTVEPEAVEDQKNITELMTAIGQYLNGIGPLVANGTMPFQAAQSMLLAICRRYRFGGEVEDYIKAMQPPKPPDQGKQQAEQMKMQAEEKREQERHQSEMQIKQLEGQQRQQEAQVNAGLAQEKANLERERMQMEMALAREEHAMKMAEMQAKAQLTQLVNDSKLKVAMTTAAMKEAQASQPRPV